MVSLAAAGAFPVQGQVALDAERMVVADGQTYQDTVPAKADTEGTPLNVMGTAAGEGIIANAAAADMEAADPVKRIWEEIDAGVTADRTVNGKRISPWSFSTSVGTSFLSFPRVGSAMNMYAAPQLNFAATGRLGLHAGVSVGRTLPLTGLVSDEITMNTGITNISTYVAASYLLTDNLVIHGSGSRSVLMVPVDGDLQSVQFNDLSIGATYNFGNFSIGATIHHSDAPLFGPSFGSGSSMYGTPLFW